MRRGSPLLALAVVVAACGDGARPAASEPVPSPWTVIPSPTPGRPPLPDGVRSLRSMDATTADADLAPFAAILGGAKVVALGEATSGSGGFVAAKARLTRFLVETLGFRVIALEANRADAARADAFVGTCRGDAGNALVGSLAVWATPDVRDMLAWACDFNRAHTSNPVGIAGIDVQDPVRDARDVDEGLRRLAPADADGLLTPLSTCSRDATHELSRAQYDACRAALDDVDVYVERRRDLGARKAEVASLQIALTSWRAWQTVTFYAGADTARASDARDEAMAAITEMIAVREDGARVVIWAANTRVTARRDRATSRATPGSTSMGTALRADFGDAYRAIGLVGYDIGASSPSGAFVPPRRPNIGSIEAKLHALGGASLLVDLRDSGLASFLPPGARYEVGAPAAETVEPREQFRALLYLDASPPMAVLDPRG